MLPRLSTCVYIKVKVHDDRFMYNDNPDYGSNNTNNKGIKG